MRLTLKNSLKEKFSDKPGAPYGDVHEERPGKDSGEEGSTGRSEETEKGQSTGDTGRDVSRK